MHKFVRWVVLTVVAGLILVACQSAEQDVAVVVEPTEAPAVVATDPPATDAPPPTSTSLPTDVPATEAPAVVEEPTVVTAADSSAMAEEPAVAEEPAEAEEPTVAEESTVAEEAVAETIVEDPLPVVADLGGYTNVRYTQAHADLIGTTGRPQLLNVFAHW